MPIASDSFRRRFNATRALVTVVAPQILFRTLPDQVFDLVADLLGAFLGSAANRLHRQPDVVIVGQGADRRVREELRQPHSCIIGSTTFSPELYGEKLIPLALKILRGESVPPAVYMEHTFIQAVPETKNAETT